MSDVVKERRRFFRIQDSVIVNYKIVPNAQIKGAVHSERIGRMAGHHLQNALGCIDRQLDDELFRLMRENPHLATTLDLINKKLDLLARMVKTTDADFLEQPAREVNLSASGIAFRTGTPLNEGVWVDMQLVLFPEYTYITTFGKVVSCQQEQGIEPDYPYRIAVDFEQMSTEDRDAVMQHVLHVQAETIASDKGRGAAARG